MTYKTKITKCKIKDIAKIYKGKGLTLDKVNSFEGKSCILYGDLYTKYETIAENIIHKTTIDEGLLSKPNSVLIPGDTTADAWGMAKAVALKEKNVLLGSSINILELNDNCDNIFFAYYLSSKKRKDIAKLVEGSTILHLYGKDIKEIEITYPEFSEQKKIGCFFKEIDQLIELEKKKKIKLTKLFNYYLKLFFNKEGNIKLEELVEIYKGKQLNKSIMHDSYPYKVYNGSTSHIGYWKEANEYANTIIINEGGSAGNIYFIEEDFWASGHSYIVKLLNDDDEVNYKYLFYILKSIENKIKIMQKGSTIKSISKDDILSMKVSYSPSHITNKQVLTLDYINEVIKLTDKEIENLEKKKKYYLNKIFC